MDKKRMPRPDNKKIIHLRDAAVTLTLIFLILYGFGALDSIISGPSLNNLKDVQIPDKYINIKPYGIVKLTKNGIFSFKVKNTGTEVVSLKGITIINPEVGLCPLGRFVPAKMAPEEVLDYIATNCSSKDAKIGKTFKLHVEITAESTKRTFAREMARQSGLSISMDMSSRVNNMPDGHEDIRYLSKGTLYGVYQ